MRCALETLREEATAARYKKMKRTRRCVVGHFKLYPRAFALPFWLRTQTRGICSVPSFYCYSLVNTDCVLAAPPAGRQWRPPGVQKHEQVCAARRDLMGPGLRQRHEAGRLRTSLQVHRLDPANHQCQLEFRKDVKNNNSLKKTATFDHLFMCSCVCFSFFYSWTPPMSPK